MTLLVDNREHDEMKKLLSKYITKYMPNNSVEISIENIDDVVTDEVKFAQLEVGDYADPENGFAVERKSSDFVSEIRSGNLFQKLLELSQYPKSYLIIDRPLEEVYAEMWKRIDSDRKLEYHKKKKNFHGQKNMVVGAIASCCIRGYPPIFCTNKKEAAQLIVRLYYKAKDNKDRQVVKALRPKVTHKDRALNVVVNYPFVGEQTAVKLLEHYGSVEKINEGLKKLFLKPNKELMRELGINKRNLEQTIAVLIGDVNGK